MLHVVVTGEVINDDTTGAAGVDEAIIFQIDAYVTNGGLTAACSKENEVTHLEITFVDCLAVFLVLIDSTTM